MGNFEKFCSVASSKAQSDINYVGAVCRLNGDDSHVFSVRNVEYGKPDEPPEVPLPAKLGGSQQSQTMAYAAGFPKRVEFASFDTKH